MRLPKDWHLQVYLVLGVVSLYQSDFEPTAQFDHRQLLLPASGSVKGGSNGNNGVERKKSGGEDRNGVRFASSLGDQSLKETAAPQFSSHTLTRDKKYPRLGQKMRAFQTLHSSLGTQFIAQRVDLPITNYDTAQRQSGCGQCKVAARETNKKQFRFHSYLCNKIGIF